MKCLDCETGNYVLMYPESETAFYACDKCGGCMRVNWHEKIAAMQEVIGRLQESLTPSGDTKAAYSGEFSFETECGEYNTECGEYNPCELAVPWTTIKAIMKAIKARANKPNCTTPQPCGVCDKCKGVSDV